MKKLLSRLWEDESGQGLVEYVLIIALVAIGLIAIMLVFRNSIGNIFSVIKQKLGDAPGNQY
jgi:pilus assembly protein Flp/PilA